MEKRTSTGAANMGKKAYDSPRLAVFGDLQRITKGAGGSDDDRRDTSKT
jgi:hypothetical protein